MARHADPEPELSEPDDIHAGLDGGDSAEVNGVDDGAEMADDRVVEVHGPPSRAALIVTLAIVVSLTAVVGWLSFQAYESHLVQRQREAFLQVGRQAAIDLTTVDSAHVEADVARIVDSSTGTFHDDFNQRAQTFEDMVKKAQSNSVGAIAAAGLESVNGNEAQVLVAVQVKTSIAGAPADQPRGWRMRVNVQRVGDALKVSNVAFVP